MFFAESHLDPTTPENPSDGLFSAADWEKIENLFKLSTRETIVTRMLVEGFSRQQIAMSLKKEDGASLSPETVRVYRDRLFQKLNVHNEMQMVLRIVRLIMQDRP